MSNNIVLADQWHTITFQNVASAVQYFFLLLPENDVADDKWVLMNMELVDNKFKLYLNHYNYRNVIESKIDFINVQAPDTLALFNEIFKTYINNNMVMAMNPTICAPVNGFSSIPELKQSFYNTYKNWPLNNTYAFADLDAASTVYLRVSGFEIPIVSGSDDVLKLLNFKPTINTINDGYFESMEYEQDVDLTTDEEFVDVEQIQIMLENVINQALKSNGKFDSNETPSNRIEYIQDDLPDGILAIKSN